MNKINSISRNLENWSQPRHNSETIFTVLVIHNSMVPRGLRHAPRIDGVLAYNVDSWVRFLRGREAGY